MITFIRRRLLNTAATVAIMVAIIFFYSYLDSHFYPTATISGISLYVLILFLAAYNVRKKITSIPMIKSSTWLQAHIYVGYISIFIFLLHISFRIPNGLNEILLALSFVLVVFSGIFGLYISRRFPIQMTQRNGTVIYEEIFKNILGLRERAEATVFDCMKDSNQSTLADFYVYRLAPYFSRPKNFWNHCVGSSRHLLKLGTAVNGVKRYLSEKEIESLKQLERLIEEKNELDFQYTMQTLLKRWLFLHIPLSYVLIVLGSFHAILALRFAG